MVYNITISRWNTRNVQCTQYKEEFRDIINKIHMKQGTQIQSWEGKKNQSDRHGVKVSEYNKEQQKSKHNGITMLKQQWSNVKRSGKNA